MASQLKYAGRRGLHSNFRRYRRFPKLPFALRPLLVRPGWRFVIHLLVVQAGHPLAESLLEFFENSNVLTDLLRDSVPADIGNMMSYLLYFYKVTRKESHSSWIARR